MLNISSTPRSAVEIVGQFFENRRTVVHATLFQQMGVQVPDGLIAHAVGAVGVLGEFAQQVVQKDGFATWLI